MHPLSKFFVLNQPFRETEGSDELPETIEFGGVTQILDPTAKLINGAVYTRDASAYVNPETGAVYAYWPYAFTDPRDSTKAYSL
jgi:hypothetical protein